MLIPKIQILREQQIVIVQKTINSCYNIETQNKKGFRMQVEKLILLSCLPKLRGQIDKLPPKLVTLMKEESLQKAGIINEKKKVEIKVMK